MITAIFYKWAADAKKKHAKAQLVFLQERIMAEALNRDIQEKCQGRNNDFPEAELQDIKFFFEECLTLELSSERLTQLIQSHLLAFRACLILANRHPDREEDFIAYTEEVLKALHKIEGAGVISAEQNNAIFLSAYDKFDQMESEAQRLVDNRL